MHLTHRIALCPTPEQADYFVRACGTARTVWNWALAEWNRQYAAGQKPNAMALKKQFNAIKYREFKAALRRLKIRSRRLSRKIEAAKITAGFAPNARLPKGTRLPVSSNRQKSAQALARLHARIANIRADFIHKLTTRLCRENQAVVIEDLHVKGMLANDKLARAISDVGFGMFRSQMEYKARCYGTRLVFAERWYLSSRLCSVCGWKHETLTLGEREWTCPECGTHHDRDLNAAINLQRLATATALPVASPSGNGGATSERVSGVVGKVTPVRDEHSHRDGSGQEENRAHLCALS